MEEQKEYEQPSCGVFVFAVFFLILSAIMAGLACFVMGYYCSDTTYFWVPMAMLSPAALYFAYFLGRKKSKKGEKN